MTRPALILHGGAGARRERNYDAEVVHMREVVEAMRARLDAGDSALNVAVEAVAMLEASGLYVAGRGASPNLAQAYELDASLMDGSDQRAGAVAALQGFKSPIRTARAPMDDALLSQALRREARRGGQSFVVVPRIEDMAPMAPHLNLWIVARGINIGLNTRMYFDDEAEANAADPVLNLIEWENRRATLIATRSDRDGTPVYRFDIRLQGENETVFFDV